MNSEFSLMPHAASEFASKVDVFYAFMVAVSLFFTFLISAVVIYFAIRYRRRSNTDRPPEIHGNNLLEIVWSVIPLILAMVMFFWAAHLYFDYAQTPRDAMEVLVTGKQWMWKVQHPDGTREINELHVPVGQTVKLTMTSEDVIHSFYIPAFRVKADVLPGRYTRQWFKATRPGKYHLFCAEYCGTEHSMMGGWVYVMPPADYEAWLAAQGGAGVVTTKMTPEKAGELLFTKMGCVTCHAGESGQLGPTLVGVFGTEQQLETGEAVVADEDYIRESILNPQAKLLKGYLPVMPTFEGQVNETQLMQLIAYIKSLTGDRS